MSKPNEETETRPLLGHLKEKQLRTPTKSFLLPVGLFFYAAGLQLSSTTISQYVYNYTSINDSYLNTSLSKNLDNQSHVTCNNNATSTNKADDKDSANWLMYFEVVEYTVGLPVIAFAGIYSDFYGRKVFIIIPALGASLYLIGAFLVIYFDLNIFFMLVAYGVQGITGTHYTFDLAATTFVADTTGRGKSRSFHIVMIHTYIGIGLALAQLGSGFLIRKTGFAIPCAVSAGACLLACVFLYLVQETLTDTLKSTKPPFLQTFFRFFGFFYGKGYAKRIETWKFVLSMSAFLIVLSPLTVITNIRTLYTLGEPFCFSSEMIGYIGAATDLAYLVLGTIVLRLLHLCLHDEIIIYLGLVSGISYYILMALSTKGWMIFMGAGVAILSTIPLQLYRGIMSRMMSEKHQGALFAVIYFLEGIGRIASNSLFLTIYGRTQNFMEGFVFMVMAGFYLISALVFIPVAISNTKQRKEIFTLIVNVDSPHEKQHDDH